MLIIKQQRTFNPVLSEANAAEILKIQKRLLVGIKCRRFNQSYLLLRALAVSLREERERV